MKAGKLQSAVLSAPDSSIVTIEDDDANVRNDFNVDNNSDILIRHNNGLLLLYEMDDNSITSSTQVTNLPVERTILKLNYGFLYLIY